MSVVDFLLTCFHGVVEGIKNFGLLVHNVFQFNFHLLSSLFSGVSVAVVTAIHVVQEGWYVMADILVNIGEFLLELMFCIRSLLMLVWKFVLLLWHALTFVLSTAEFLAVSVWTCVVIVVKTISQTFVDVAGGCGATLHYGKGLVGGTFSSTVEGFAMLGHGVENVCLAVWNGVIGTIKHASHSCVDFVFGRVHDLKRDIRYVFVEVFPNIQREAYVGVVVCLGLYLILSNLPRVFQFMHSRGLTFPFVGGRRVANIIVNDSDEDFLDSESEVSDGHADPNDIDDDDADSVMTRGGDSADESTSDTNDDSNSNYDSDHDIDIQLPPENLITRTLSRCGLRRRTQTPTLSEEQKANMSREELELEVEREKDKRACVVCQDRQKNVLILPCRHLCLCLQCANQIARAHFIDNRVCPLCRTRIKTIMDIYV